jgi:hypothetical protein
MRRRDSAGIAYRCVSICGQIAKGYFVDPRSRWECSNPSTLRLVEIQITPREEQKRHHHETREPEINQSGRYYL